jgi:hypothetical protein
MNKTHCRCYAAPGLVGRADLQALQVRQLSANKLEGWNERGRNFRFYLEDGHPMNPGSSTKVANVLGS